MWERVYHTRWSIYIDPDNYNINQSCCGVLFFLHFGFDTHLKREKKSFLNILDINNINDCGVAGTQ